MSDESGSEDGSPVEALQKKHRQEKKELQGNIQKLKSAIKGDKKKKKEVQAEITRLEQELQDKHSAELQQLKNEETITKQVNHLHVVVEDGDASPTQKEPNKKDGDASPPQKEPTKKMSKAQKRREKKAISDREREQQIHEQETLNVTGARHQEAHKLKQVLGNRQLAIKEIPSDGNCLYAAVEDQLKRRGIEHTVKSLRQQTATFMRSHQDDFLPFLTKASGDPYTAEEYTKYCDDVESTTAWGGQPEIQALANVLQCSIEVVQAEMPSIVQGQEFTQPKSLILSYHRHTYTLGEHYNSVINRPAETNDEFT
eukprot:GHVU01095260.1.p1 GENE.GHVU01095260.1~~GHVU01095260.1.p1  ORF type:complete len:321 (+),score=54.26 GHVU01095260.1:27-965(+)